MLGDVSDWKNVANTKVKLPHFKVRLRLFSHFSLNSRPTTLNLTAVVPTPRSEAPERTGRCPTRRSDCLPTPRACDRRAPPPCGCCLRTPPATSHWSGSAAECSPHRTCHCPIGRRSY